MEVVSSGDLVRPLTNQVGYQNKTETYKETKKPNRLENTFQKKPPNHGIKPHYMNEWCHVSFAGRQRCQITSHVKDLVIPGLYKYIAVVQLVW